MHENVNQKSSASQIEIEFTEKPITPYGGMAIINRFFGKVNIHNALNQALPDDRNSNNATPVVDIGLGLLFTVLCGGSRFSHTERIRGDEALRTVAGVKKLPSQSVYTRYFNTFGQGEVERMWSVLWNHIADLLPQKSGAYTLDLDSSVLTRYGSQEGARKGYNPKKPGRPSHRPMFAFLSELKICPNLWLRSGNTADLTGIEEFLDETLARLPGAMRIKAVRADSGFFAKSVFDYMEHKNLKYAVYVRMNKRVQRAIVGIEDWKPVEGDPHREVGEVEYQALNWDKPRRMVVVRELVREGKDNRGRMLFDMPDYTYSAVITDLEDEPLEVWRFYNKRAGVENRIKELKYDFAADGFCLDSFFGTEAVLRLITFLFNLMTLFANAVLKRPGKSLKSVRYTVVVIGSWLGSGSNRKVLRMSEYGKQRKLLQLLINRIESLTTLQLRCSWMET